MNGEKDIFIKIGFDVDDEIINAKIAKDDRITKNDIKESNILYTIHIIANDNSIPENAKNLTF